MASGFTVNNDFSKRTFNCSLYDTVEDVHNPVLINLMLCTAEWITLCTMMTTDQFVFSKTLHSVRPMANRGLATLRTFSFRCFYLMFDFCVMLWNIFIETSHKRFGIHVTMFLENYILFGESLHVIEKLSINAPYRLFPVFSS